MASLNSVQPSHDPYKTSDEDKGESIPQPLIVQSLMLPTDIYSNPFGKSTFSLPMSRLPRLRQLHKAARRSLQPFRLMDLPTELRLSVLAHHFGKRTIALTYCGQLIKRRNWFVHGRETQSDDLAILLACRQLHNEAEDVLFEFTTFVLKVEGSPSAKSGKKHCMPSLLQQLPDAMVDKIRLAIFHIDIPSLIHAETESPCVPSNILKDIAEMPSLKTAELHFDFNCVRNHALVDGIFALFQDTVEESRLVKLSSVRMRRDQELSLRRPRQYVPFNQLESYRKLLEKFDAVDVSDETCGKTMTTLRNGILHTVDTSILKQALN